MQPGDEVQSPTAATPSPAPPTAGGPGDPPTPAPAPAPAADSTRPTPETVLRWVAASGDTPWFPSAHAKQAGIPRDSLDAPLNELREAGLVRVVTWVRGVGQGYVATEEGGTRPPGPAATATTSPDAEPTPAVRAIVNLDVPVVTPALILANLVWFAAGVVFAWRGGVPLTTYLIGGNRGVLARLGAVTADDLLRGEWWRLLTCCFVHVGGLHLILNMVGLGMAGSVAELLWGRRRLLVVYLLAGLGGSCLAMAHRPLDEATGATLLLAGASGAIWGVMASLVAWLLLFHPELPRDLVADWTRRLALAFAVNTAVSFIPGVSWEAHFGGGLVGFLAAGLLNAARFGTGRRRAAAVLLLVVLPWLCVTGLVTAMQTADAWSPLRERAAAQRAADESREFNGQVTPLLDAIRPTAGRSELIGRAEWATIRVWLVSPDKRAAAKAEARAALEPLRAQAAEAARLLAAAPPTGHEPTNRYRAKAAAFATARVKELDLLLGTLAADTIPDAAAWKACGESKQEADRLAADLARH